MINRVNELFPKHLVDELLRLARHNRDWCKYHSLGKGLYQAGTPVHTWLRKLWLSGADVFSMWASSIWLVDGPKIFRPTVEQCRALEQVEVNLELHEYEQPYLALLVDLPEGAYPPFDSVLCHQSEKLLTCVAHSKDHKDDITTTIAVDGKPIEASLQRYDDNVKELGQVCGKALRVAVNSCLALVNFGCHADLLFPKEAERDRTYAGEDSKRGKDARERLRTSLRLVDFNGEVKLHRSEGGGHGTGTGSDKSCHWRRGHWRMQPHGPQRSLRKRIYMAPVMVRADLLLVDLSETSAVYRS